MKIARLWLAVVSLAILAAIGAGVWWYITERPAIPVEDDIVSWDFQGPYKDGGELEAETRAEIVRYEELLGSGTYNDHELLAGIAAQYELLGDGKKAYEYLNRAIKVDPDNGLAYRNLGHLMETLGAYETARTAYEKAVAVDPYVAEYQAARAQFLERRFPDEAASANP